MKVREAQALLQGLDPEEDIIMSWWGRDAFEDVSEEDWSHVVDHIEMCMDWSYAHDPMSQMIRDYIETLHD